MRVYERTAASRGVMTSRWWYGIAAAGLTGLIWASINHGGERIAPAGDSAIEVERPVSEAGDAVPQSGQRTGSARNPGGLPARDRGARRAGGSPAAAAISAPHIASAPASPSASSPSPAGARPRREAHDTAVPVATAAATASGPANSNAPSEQEKPRSRGIGGSVLEKSGTPAANLAVSLRPRRVFGGASAAPQQATTDGRGAFAFGEVADGEYEIYSEKNDRYERASTLVRAGTDSAVLVVEAVTRDSMLIRGVVESENGGVLDAVRIEVIGQAGHTAVTNAKGGYQLRVPAGSKVDQTTLRFRRTGYRDRRWAVGDGQRSSDFEVIGNVRLEPLAAGVTVTGVVTSTEGAPVARARVQLDAAARGRGYRGVTDGAGRFTLDNVEAGPGYRLWVRPAAGFKDGVLDNVIADAATPLEVTVAPIGAATLRGRLVTPDGAAVPGFTMWLTPAYGGGPRSVQVTSNAQGRFEIKDLPEGPAAMQTRAAPALSVSGIEVKAAADAADVTVVVDVGSNRLEGRLVTSDGTPAAGARVALEWSASSGGITSRSTRQTITSAEGTFVFTDLGSGAHLVSASLAGAGSVRVEQPVGAGLTPVQMTLPGRRGTQ